MRFSLSALAFATSLAFVNAQDLSGIPDCAVSCFATAVPESGCSLTDTKCQCTTGKDKITESITACVPSKCSPDDILKISSAVEDICKKAGVTITDVPSGVPTSGSNSSNASRTASVTGSGSATGSGQPAQNTGGAAANVIGMGAVALGLAAGVFGL